MKHDLFYFSEKPVVSIRIVSRTKHYQWGLYRYVLMITKLLNMRSAIACSIFCCIVGFHCHHWINGGGARRSMSYGLCRIQECAAIRHGKVRCIAFQYPWYVSTCIRCVLRMRAALFIINTLTLQHFLASVYRERLYVTQDFICNTFKLPFHVLQRVVSGHWSLYVPARQAFCRGTPAPIRLSKLHIDTHSAYAYDKVWSRIEFLFVRLALLGLWRMRSWKLRRWHVWTVFNLVRPQIYCTRYHTRYPLQIKKIQTWHFLGSQNKWDATSHVAILQLNCPICPCDVHTCHWSPSSCGCSLPKLYRHGSQSTAFNHSRLSKAWHLTVYVSFAETRSNNNRRDKQSGEIDWSHLTCHEWYR